MIKGRENNMTTLYSLPPITGTRDESLPLFQFSETEVWADAYGFKGFYIVSTRGNVISNHKKQETRLRPSWDDRAKRYSIQLSNGENRARKVALSRLIKATFSKIPNMHRKIVVFKDGNPRNVVLENLEWSDPLLAVLNERQVRAIRAVPHAKYKTSALAEEFGVCPETIRNIINFETWRDLK